MKRKVVMVRRPCSCEAWPFCEHASNATKAETHTQAPASASDRPGVIEHDGKPAHTSERVTIPAYRTSATFCSRCADWFYPVPPVETAETVLQAIADYWGINDQPEPICPAPVYPGAYLTEHDEPIKDVVFRVLRAAQERRPLRELPATPHTGDTISALLDVVDQLRECLKEAHAPDLASCHGGDENHTGSAPESCSYCAALQEAEDVSDAAKAEAKP